MISVSEILTLAGALISAVATLSVALARIKSLEKKVDIMEAETERIKNLRTDDKTILVRLETKMDMLLSGKIYTPRQGGKK